MLVSVSADSTLKVFDIAAHRQARSTRIAQLALSACQLTREEKHVVVSSWDNNMYAFSIRVHFALFSCCFSYLYALDTSRVVDLLYVHDDAVSALAVGSDLIVTGSWDTTVKVH